jgi:hypothetical protein
MLKLALERAASADHRPLANLVQIVLREWAVKNGHLDESQNKKPAG